MLEEKPVGNYIKKTINQKSNLDLKVRRNLKGVFKIADYRLHISDELGELIKVQAKKHYTTQVGFIKRVLTDYLINQQKEASNK